MLLAQTPHIVHQLETECAGHPRDKHNQAHHAFVGVVREQICRQLCPREIAVQPSHFTVILLLDALYDVSDKNVVNVVRLQPAYQFLRLIVPQRMPSKQKTVHECFHITIQSFIVHIRYHQ